MEATRQVAQPGTKLHKRRYIASFNCTQRDVSGKQFSSLTSGGRVHQLTSFRRRRPTELTLSWVHGKLASILVQVRYLQHGNTLQELYLQWSEGGSYNYHGVMRPRGWQTPWVRQLSFSAHMWLLIIEKTKKNKLTNSKRVLTYLEHYQSSAKSCNTGFDNQIR